MRKPKKVAVKPTYVGDDPAQFVWSNRTHRSASEAFRDADYATAIWKCESDFQLAVRFIVEMGQGMFIVGMCIAVPVLLVMWVTK